MDIFLSASLCSSASAFCHKAVRKALEEERNLKNKGRTRWLKSATALGFLVVMDTVFSIVGNSGLYGELTLRARTLQRQERGLDVAHFIFQ